MSLPEVLLWDRLRRRAGAIKFRRQHPSKPYILDFYCAKAKLAVEIDSASHLHGDRPKRDVAREQALIARGLHVVRVTAAEVLHNADAVADEILRSALPLHRPSGGPPPQAALGEDLAGAH